MCVCWGCNTWPSVLVHLYFLWSFRSLEVTKDFPSHGLEAGAQLQIVQPFHRSEDSMCGHDDYTLHTTETNSRSGIYRLSRAPLKQEGGRLLLLAVFTGRFQSGEPCFCIITFQTLTTKLMHSQDRLKIDIDPVLLVFGNPKRKKPLFLIEIQCG